MYIERSRVISAEAILAITVADALSGLGRAAWAPSMATYNVDSKWKPKLVCLLQAMLIMDLTETLVPTNRRTPSHWSYTWSIMSAARRRPRPNFSLAAYTRNDKLTTQHQINHASVTLSKRLRRWLDPTAPGMISHTIGFASLLGFFAVSSVVFTCTLVQLALSHHSLLRLSTIQQADGSSPSMFHRTQIQTHDDYSMSRYPFSTVHTDMTDLWLLYITSTAYVDDDFPPRLLEFEPGNVQLAVEESVRYSPWDAEGPAEWSSTSPPGEGSVRLGRDGRVFYLSMFHELHCLRRIQKSLRDPQSVTRPAVLGHTQHCLNYLRQWSLCQADRTLEVGDFVTRNFTADRVGAVHTCRDWRAVYDRVTYDWSNWKDAAPHTDSDNLSGPKVSKVYSG